MDIRELKRQGQKIFLYAPQYPRSEAATEKIIKEWQKKTFGVKDVLLVFFLEQTIDWYRYPVRWVYHSLGSCAPIVSTMNRYNNFVELLTESDYYIVDSLEASLDDIKIVCDCGGEIIPTFAEGDLFPMLEYTDEQKIILENYQRLVYENLIGKYSPYEYEYMLVHNGLGETVVFYYSIAEYKRKNRDRPLVVLCYDESRKSMLEESPHIDVVAHVPFPLYEYIAVFLSEEYCMKNLMEIFYTPDVVAAMANVDYKFCYFQAVRKYLGLLDTPLQKYRTNVSEIKRKAARAIIKKWNLRKGRTVWLCMDGISSGSLLDSNFLNDLVESIRKKDYDVIMKSDKSIIACVPYAVLPPWETTELVSLCGNAISIPTGISFAVGAMNMDRPLKIQMIRFEGMENRNSHMGQFMWTLPLIRKFGRNYMEHLNEFEEELYGDNVDLKTIPVYKGASLNELILRLVDGLA